MLGVRERSVEPLALVLLPTLMQCRACFHERVLGPERCRMSRCGASNRVTGKIKGGIGYVLSTHSLACEVFMVVFLLKELFSFVFSVANLGV